MAWAEIITTTLTQLLTAGGVAAAGSATYPLYQIGKYFASLTQGAQAAQSNGIVDRVISEAVHMVIGDQQVSKPGSAVSVKNRDVKDAVAHVRQTLQDYGVTIDSEILANKIRAELGKLVLSKLNLPAPKIVVAPAPVVPAATPPTP